MSSPTIKLYFTFSFLFFGCIPYLEHSNKIFSYWGLPDVTSDFLFLINIIIFFLNIAVIISYRVSGVFPFETLQRFYSSKELIFAMKKTKREINYKDSFLLLLCLALFSTFVVVYVNNFSFINLVYRDSVFDRVSLNSSLSLVVNYLIKPIPAIALIYYLSYKPVNYKYKSTVLFFLCLINVFPTGVPRFYAAAVYIPILILLFNGLLLKSRLSFFIIVSIFFIFPFLNIFRRKSTSENTSLFDGFDFLYHGHFDSYLSIGQVVQSDFITYGRQLLGSLLFFVPRIIWPDKPTGTGHTLVTHINMPFANVSANYYAEGYANFGYIGMFLFAFVLGFILRRLDEKFFMKLNLGIGADDIVPLYLISLGFLIFIMRGDLLSSLSFFIGFFFCVKFISIFFKKYK